MTDLASDVMYKFIFQFADTKSAKRKHGTKCLAQRRKQTCIFGEKKLCTKKGRGGRNKIAFTDDVDALFGNVDDYAAGIFRLRYLMKEREVYYEKKNK